MDYPSGRAKEAASVVTNASSVGVSPTAIATFLEVGGTILGCPLGLLVEVPGAIWPIPVWMVALVGPCVAQGKGVIQ